MKSLHFPFILLSLVLLFFCATPAAAEQQKYLVVNLKNGEKMLYAASSLPEFQIIKETVQVSSIYSCVRLNLDDVQNIGLSDMEVPASIDVPQFPEAAHAAFSHGQLLLTGLDAKSHVDVYAIGGQSVSRLQASDDGLLVVDLSAYGSGTYIVKTSKSTLKIVTK